MAEALYRKYRPQIFEDVVGQEHIERTLKNAIASDKVSHAYLFTGPRGTGKTTTARLLAKALLCENGPTPDPDGTCEDCELVAKGEHPDVYELDAASRTGVENVREEIIGRVSYAPTRGRYKIYIIDEVHMLSVAAFNALLKTLEEPPSHVVFILCTTDPHKVPETIQSRCQRFDFRRISAEELISRLGYICGMEGISFEPEALDLIAHRAQGGMRDALTSLEQLIAFSDGSITTEQAERMLGSVDSSDMAEIVLAIGKRDAAQCFRWTRQYMETGSDLAQFAQDLAEHVRDMYIVSLTGADIAIDLTESARRELESELALFGPDRLSRMLCVLGDLIAELKTSSNQRLSFEIALTRLIRPDSDITLESLAERIESLESGVGSAGAGADARALPSSQSSLRDQAGNTSAHSQVAPQVQAQPQTQNQSDTQHHQPVQPQSTESSQPQAAVQQQGQSQQSEQQAQSQDAPQVGAMLEMSEANLPQIWNKVYAQLKKIAVQYGALFMNVRPAYDATSTKVVINFDSSKAFEYKAAQSAKTKAALKEAFAKAGYGDVLLQLAQADLGGIVNSQSSSIESVQQVQPSHLKSAQQSQTSLPQDSQPEPLQDLPPYDDEYIGDDSVEDDFAAVVDAQPSIAINEAQASQPQTEQMDSGQDAQEEIISDGQTDIADLLSSTFGEGIVFEEVDE